MSWAGEDGDAGWLDIGREFTEQWHHQMQIRDAVGAAPLPDPAWRLLFNGLARDEISTRVQVHGDAELVTPLLAARSVIV